jgi:hypothetical protein
MLNADPVLMKRAASYSVLILRSPNGYQAYAPAFPDLVANASSGRIAYARVKVLIEERVAYLLGETRPLPRDPVFRTRVLRLDLVYLTQREGLS